MTFVWILLFNFAPSSALNAALQSLIYRLIKLVISINFIVFFTPIKLLKINEIANFIMLYIVI